MLLLKTGLRTGMQPVVAGRLPAGPGGGLLPIVPWLRGGVRAVCGVQEPASGTMPAGCTVATQRLGADDGLGFYDRQDDGLDDLQGDGAEHRIFRQLLLTTSTLFRIWHKSL